MLACNRLESNNKLTRPEESCGEIKG
uniref:5-methyltetrahydropteroyltriglutamatehomocysteine methyltransferase-like n=1 Tax=Rhizophora mucronata TaxID=61149 RepID=A0A2P2LBG9_RHIMU